VLSEEDDETPVALLQDGKIIGEVNTLNNNSFIRCR